MSFSPKLRLQVNQLAEFGAQQEPEDWAENDRETRDLLRLYEREARAFPLLTAEEEISLGEKMERAEAATRKLGQGGLNAVAEADLEAQIEEGEQAEKRFIESNLRLVIYWAERYLGQGMGLPDLVQEGNIGLIRAVRRFDHTRGQKFSTYGSHWIRQTIRRAIAKKARTIRLPVHMNGKIKRLYRTRRRLVQKLAREPTVRELALESNLLNYHEQQVIRSALEEGDRVPPDLGRVLEDAEEEVRRMLRVSRETVSLEMTVDPHDHLSLWKVIPDDRGQGPAEALENHMVHQQLESLLEELSPREYRVIEMRFGLHNLPTHTLQEIGDVFDLTRERIRQIEEQALRKLTLPAWTRGFSAFLRSGARHSGCSRIPRVEEGGPESAPVAPRQARSESSDDREESGTDDEGAAWGDESGPPCYPELIGDIAPIGVLELSQASHDALVEADITTVGTLAVMSVEELCQLDGIDTAVSQRICEKLRQYEEPHPAQTEHRSAMRSRGDEVDEEMATPFSAIFVDRDEAEWAFDLIRETLGLHGVTDAEDKRFSVALLKKRRILQLSFGNWGHLLRFTNPDYSQNRVGMALIQDEAKLTGLSVHWKPFEGTEDDLPISMYRFPMKTARPLTGELRRAYEKTFAHISARFRGLEASPYRRRNVMEIAGAVFDAEERCELLSGGLRDCAGTSDDPTGEGAPRC